MTASLVFQLANGFAAIGWLVLACSVLLKRNYLGDVVAGQIWPIALSFAYTTLIIFFWAKAEGGFDSLANVQKLFSYQWAALAGWIHYLAFDLLVGSLIAKWARQENMPRLILVALLPLTFLFGPIGYFGFQICRLIFKRVEIQS